MSSWSYDLVWNYPKWVCVLPVTLRESIQKREELVLHMFRMKAAAAPCRVQEFEAASDAVVEKEAQIDIFCRAFLSLQEVVTGNYETDESGGSNSSPSA